MDNKNKMLKNKQQVLEDLLNYEHIFNSQKRVYMLAEKIVQCEM